MSKRYTILELEEGESIVWDATKKQAYHTQRADVTEVPGDLQMQAKFHPYVRRIRRTDMRPFAEPEDPKKNKARKQGVS